MFTVSFIANMLKRHPRCMKLIHRAFKVEASKTVESDPYREDEEDPMDSKALKSNLWEAEVLMTHHYDERVRNYCKLFKTEF